MKPVSDRKSWQGSSGDAIKLVLPLSQPEILQHVDKRGANEQTALHHASISQNMECLKLLLTCYPESERLQVVNMEDRNGKTISRVSWERELLTRLCLCCQS